jgi:hypothetical protein
MVGTVLSPESARYAGLKGFDLAVIPYAVSLAGVRQTVQVYHEALREAGHAIVDHHVHATFHLYVERDEASAIATIRQPILDYVQCFADALIGDRWSRDYAGYEGLVHKVRALRDFDVLYDRRTLFGDPARLHETIAQARDAGITEMSFITMMPGLTQQRILDSLRLFASDVMPKYR